MSDTGAGGQAGGQGAMALYMRELRGIPRLGASEEQQAARRAAAGDESARQLLVKANLPFVIMLARQYAGRGAALEDLVSEGNLGLLLAARRFDPERGVRFVTYAAWWVRQAILKAVRQAAAGPAGAGWILSLDSGMDAEDGEPLGARVQDRSFPGPEDAAVGVAVRDQVRAVLAGLPARDAAIVQDRFGLAGTAGIPLREAARRHGLSSERVRQIEKRTLRRIRAAAGAAGLEAFAC